MRQQLVSKLHPINQRYSHILIKHTTKLYQEGEASVRECRICHWFEIFQFGMMFFCMGQLTVVKIQNQMIINSTGYSGSLKDRNSNFKKKSHEALIIKTKWNSQITEQLKSMHRKPQQKSSTSIVEVPTKEDPRRACSSLEMPCSELSMLEGMQPARGSTNKQKKNIGSCWSQRNIALVNDANKMHKFRKLSSNAQLCEQQSRPQSQRRKLSLVQAPTKKIDRLGVMAWLVLIRKLFVDEFRKRSSRVVRLSFLYSYIQKLDNEGLDQFSLIIEPLDYEPDLTKSQIVTILENYFSQTKKTTKTAKTEQGKASFHDVVTCLLHFQSKNTNIKPQPKANSSEEQAVETARFQEGGDQKKKKMSQKKSQLNNLMPKMQTHKYIKENGKENAVISSNINAQSLFKSPSACQKSRQSLNPSQSPFTITDSRSIQNSGGVLIEREDSGPLLFKRSAFENDGGHSGLLGMLTIQGKSPRELMVSEIYESIQKEGFIHNNNVSFSLENLEIDNHLSFEHTVHSFEEVLRKIQSIQSNYKAKLDQQLDQPKFDKNEEEVNLFLQQLINYRIASSNEPFEEQAYSYLVSFQNLCEFKEHNRGIMVALLQSTSLKEYFNALEGIKIHNSPPFLKNITHLLHPTIRILNLTNNSLQNLNFFIDSLPPENALQFLNIGHNLFTDISPILRKCGKLRQLHCHSNLIASVKDGKVASQQLKIIDLSFNKLQHQNDLSGLVGVSSLIIINILNNPFSQGKWKDQWSGSISLNNIYTMDNLYVMSAYGHQKDITFSIDKPNRNKDRITEFSSISENVRINNEPKYTKQAQTPKTDPFSIAKFPSKPPEPPKQKISKIKAFIEGKPI